MKLQELHQPLQSNFFLIIIFVVGASIEITFFFELMLPLQSVFLSYRSQKFCGCLCFHKDNNEFNFFWTIDASTPHLF